MKKKTGLPRAIELLADGNWQAAHEIVQEDDLSKLPPQNELRKVAKGSVDLESNG